MLALASLLAALATSAVAETVHGVVVFTRHGDRTTRMFPGYHLTNLGANQAYNSGSFYRQRYVDDEATSRIANISADLVNYNQIWASAPNQGLLFQTAVNFLQGLYPPLDSQLATETLNNGTQYTAPLDGYQFILVQGQPATSPDTIWIKGDDNCPRHIAAQRSYMNSSQYKDIFNATSGFYSRFDDLLEPILGQGEVTYKNAYEIFDLMNVASIHNQSLASNISNSDLTQLRYLADQWEWNYNFNASQTDRMMGGRTLAGGILQRMNETVSRRAQSNKFQLLSGSYDTFLMFFGLANLTTASDDFYGLPGYASTMAFELFTESGTAAAPAAFPAADSVNDTLRVRFLFRNGTDAGTPLVSFPLFGSSESTLPYGTFVERMRSFAVTSSGQWCQACDATAVFCPSTDQASSSPSGSSGSHRLSNAAAGGIGAGVTLAVVAILAGLLFFVLRKKATPTSSAVVSVLPEKRVSESDSA